MNGTHIHLLLNHLPIIGLPIGLLILLVARIQKNEGMTRFAFLFTAVVGLMAIPVFLTGEPAEEAVEHLPGVTRTFIHNHEEAGEVAMVLSILSAALAAVLLFIPRFQNAKKFQAKGIIALIVVLGVAAGSLAYTGYLGGQIRHTEIRDGAAAQ